MPITSDFRRHAWLVVPAYNEGSVIRSVIAEIVTRFENVVVVDDGSQDVTGREAAEAGATVLTHAVNLGQGAALQTGITYALRRHAQFIVTFDADGQHSLDDVDTMLEMLVSQHCDVVLGSRFLGSTENLPFLRRYVLKLAVIFTRLSSGMNLTDTHNGLRVFTSDAAQGIRLQQNGMAHASEILKQIATLKHKYVEAPIHIRYTEYSLKKGQKLSNAFRILMDLFVARMTK